MAFPGADIYFTGHTHELYFNEGNLVVDTASGMEVFKEQLQIVGGSFTKWAKYARDKNMMPRKPGCYVLEISENGVKLKGKI